MLGLLAGDWQGGQLLHTESRCLNSDFTLAVSRVICLMMYVAFVVHFLYISQSHIMYEVVSACCFLFPQYMLRKLYVVCLAMKNSNGMRLENSKVEK